MNRGAAAVVDEFLSRQLRIYGGHDLTVVDELLSPDVVWHVPGSSPIAGDYRGREAVLRYFDLRRTLTNETIRIEERGRADHNDAVVRLADGRARLGGRDVVWRTAEVYRVANARIVEAWLVPLGQESFDQAWAQARTPPFIYTQRVRPQECAASTMLGHPRYLEFFEAAFIECWRDRFGQIDATLGRSRRLTVAAVNVRYLGSVRSDDEFRIAITVDRITKRSISVHYDAFVDATRVAEGSSRYVCLDIETGEPVPLPDAIATSR